MFVKMNHTPTTFTFADLQPTESELHLVLTCLYSDTVDCEEDAERIEIKCTDLFPDYSPMYKIYDVEVNSHQGQYGILDKLRISFDPALVIVDVVATMGDCTHLVYLRNADGRLNCHPVCFFW